MKVAKRLVRAVLGLVLCLCVSAWFASAPAAAHSRAYRHCYWSHHQRHCHYHPRHYSHRHYHYHYPHCTWRHPFRRCSPVYSHRPGWNSR